MTEPEPKSARDNLLDVFLDGKDRDFLVESEGGEKPMPEPEPMSWEGAELWERRIPSLGKDSIPGLSRAIALARQEKERADKIHGAYCEVLDESLRPQKAADVLARLALADKLAEAVGKLPLTGGPVVDALRAYLESTK